MLDKLNQLFRISNWWEFIIPPIFFFYFLGISQTIEYQIDYKEFIFFCLLLISIASLGFFIGECSDIEDDEKSGKNNRLKDTSVFLKITILAILCSTLYVSIQYLELIPLQIALILLQIACLVLYSLPPFRFKRNPLLSLVLDALYSGTLMFILAYSFYNENRILIYVLIGAIGFLRGARNYLLHTLKDAQFDKKIGIKSFGNSLTLPKSLFVIRGILFFEIAVTFIFLLTIEYHTNYVLVLYSLGILLVVVFSIKNRLSKIDFLSAVNINYEVLMPLFMLSFLVYKNPSIIFLLLVLIISFKSWRKWTFRVLFLFIISLTIYSIYKIYFIPKKVETIQTDTAITAYSGTSNKEKTKVVIDKTKTIVLVIDMWNHHWCKEVERKQDSLAQDINLELARLRDQGIKIMHVPSDCMGYYKDYPQHKEVTKIKQINTRRNIYTSEELSFFNKGFELQLYFFKDGCSCEPTCTIKQNWSKQHDAIEIDNNDLIATDPLEIYSYLKFHQYENIIYMGVHANMCILRRPMGFHQNAK